MCYICTICWFIILLSSLVIKWHSSSFTNGDKQTSHDQLLLSIKHNRSSIWNRMLLLIRTARKSPVETRRWMVRIEMLRNSAASLGVSRRMGFGVWLWLDIAYGSSVIGVYCCACSLFCLNVYNCFRSSMARQQAHKRTKCIRSFVFFWLRTGPRIGWWWCSNRHMTTLRQSNSFRM